MNNIGLYFQQLLFMYDTLATVTRTLFYTDFQIMPMFMLCTFAAFLRKSNRPTLIQVNNYSLKLKLFTGITGMFWFRVLSRCSLGVVLSLLSSSKLEVHCRKKMGLFWNSPAALLMLYSLLKMSLLYMSLHLHTLTHSVILHSSQTT